MLKEIAKKAYQRLFQGWAESDTITPTTAQRGRPRKVSIGSSALGTTSSASVPMPNKKCPPDVTSLYHTIKAATVSRNLVCVCVCVYICVCVCICMRERETDRKRERERERERERGRIPVKVLYLYEYNCTLSPRVPSVSVCG